MTQRRAMRVSHDSRDAMVETDQARLEGGARELRATGREDLSAITADTSKPRATDGETTAISRTGLLATPE